MHCYFGNINSLCKVYSEKHQCKYSLTLSITAVFAGHSQPYFRILPLIPRKDIVTTQTNLLSEPAHQVYPWEREKKFIIPAADLVCRRIVQLLVFWRLRGEDGRHYQHSWSVGITQLVNHDWGQSHAQQLQKNTVNMKSQHVQCIVCITL